MLQVFDAAFWKPFPLLCHKHSSGCINETGKEVVFLFSPKNIGGTEPLKCIDLEIFSCEPAKSILYKTWILLVSFNMSASKSKATLIRRLTGSCKPVGSFRSEARTFIWQLRTVALHDTLYYIHTTISTLTLTTLLLLPY